MELPGLSGLRTGGRAFSTARFAPTSGGALPAFARPMQEPPPVTVHTVPGVRDQTYPRRASRNPGAVARRLRSQASLLARRVPSTHHGWSA